jgi:hypothetical protein
MIRSQRDDTLNKESSRRTIRHEGGNGVFLGARRGPINAKDDQAEILHPIKAAKQGS